MSASTFRYAYLHGFGSSRLSRKGVFLRDELAPGGVELELLDLNVPSFGRQTYSDILASIDAFDATTAEGVKLRVLGSSMGGYLAARWAELHPDRVDRLFLLCPGFDLAFRWPILLGADAMERWEANGTLDVANGSGLERPVRRLPGTPRGPGQSISGLRKIAAAPN